MPNQIVVQEIDEKEAYLLIVGGKFPRIEERLRLLWGSAEGSAYLQELTISDREGRQGFPLEVFRALNALVLLHPEKFFRPDALESPKRPTSGRVIRDDSRMVVRCGCGGAKWELDSWVQSRRCMTW